jgi:PPM family protein phosphatase
MWNKVKVIIFRKTFFLTIAAVAVVIAFWLIVPKPIGYYHNLDILASSLIVGLSLLFPFTFNIYVKTKADVLTLKEEDKNVLLLQNEIGCLSDVGRVRELDEDCVFAAKIFSSNKGLPTEKIFIVVADGMGGHSKGEVASAIAVTSVAKDVMNLIFNKQDNGSNDLMDAVKSANTKVLEYAMEHPECEGMGTTMTATLIDRKNIHICHVGDTRAYMISDTGIIQLTKDHSFVQELVDKGEITEEEARHHPQKNIITKVVGLYAKVDPDIYDYEWNDGQVLMCCDGLVNHVDNEEIRDIVLSSQTTNKACSDLINLANKRGGKDNISVIVTPSLQQFFASK